MPLLEVRDLRVFYRRVEGLHRASLRVEEGSIVTVIGPNGAGKSTLLGAVMGLLRCTGEVRFAGTALGNEPVRIGGEVVGRVTSGGYGFAVERSIAYALLPPDAAHVATRGEVEVFGEWVPCAISAEPLYDPEGARLKS